MPRTNRRLWFSLAMISAGAFTYIVGGLATTLIAGLTMHGVGNSPETVDSLPQAVGEMSSLFGISEVISLVATGMVVAGLGLLTFDLLARAFTGAPAQPPIEA